MRSRRSGKSVTCSSPALRSRLKLALSDNSVWTPPVRSAKRSALVTVDTLAELTCARIDRAAAKRRRAAALGRDVIDVENARVSFAREDANEPGIDAVIEAERGKDRIERLPDGHVLQLTDERTVDRRVRDEAEICPADQQEQQILDRHRLGERQRERAVVEVGRRTALVELRQGQRRHPRSLRQRG